MTRFRQTIKYRLELTSSKKLTVYSCSKRNMKVAVSDTSMSFCPTPKNYSKNCRNFESFGFKSLIAQADDTVLNYSLNGVSFELLQFCSMI